MSVTLNSLPKIFRRYPRLPSITNAVTGADFCASLAAIVLLILSAAGLLAQNPAGIDPGKALSDTASLSAWGPPGVPSARETVISAYGGASYTHPSDVIIGPPGVNDFTVKDVTWDGKAFEQPPYYGARLTRWSNPVFGGMIDYTHAKTISRPDEIRDFQGTLRGQPVSGALPLKKHFYKLEFSHGHNMVTANGLVRLPALGARVSPYFGLGAGVSLPHTEVYIAREGKRTYEYQYAGPMAQALIGFEVRLPRVSLFFEYKFSFAPYEVPLTQNNSSLTLFEDLWLQYQKWRTGDGPQGGILTTTLASHHFISGVNLRFASPAP